MPHLNLDKLNAATVVSEPFSYTIVKHFINPHTIREINATFPDIRSGGSFPVDELTDDHLIKTVISELDGPEFEAAIEKKFAVQLAGHPKMYSLRGHTRHKDGRIHTDSKDKIITVLLYLNESWDKEGGRLRLLRNGHSVEDYLEEVVPDNGTLLIFRRSENSWHGHNPFEGPRRTLQMNWMTTDGAKGLHRLRHHLSAALKKLSPTG